jgi:hypothetical protein
MADTKGKPAGGSKFAKETEQQHQEAEQKERPYLKDADVWDELGGQEFGGAAGILELKEGELAGVFTYTGHQEITTDLGATTVHTASDEDGTQWRMPIQATFLRAVDQARIGMGDKFAVKREEDVTKKRGKGAGNPMAIYAIKVIERFRAEPNDK